MPDGSSVRIKVAQYYVDEKLRELENRDPHIKVDDGSFPQALPAPANWPQASESDLEPTQLAHHLLEPSNDPVSWTQLLKTFDQDRRARGLGDHEGMIPVRPPLWFRVAIIGAGVAGLRTAKLLQDMGIPYKIFEASDRPGGRIFTYQFASKPPGDPQGKHDYYDVGAMRFPNNDANEATFKLFEELGLSDKLIDYVFTRDNNIRYYNGIKSTAAEASTKGDHFKDEIVPEEFLEKEYVDLRGKTVFGVDACTAAAFDPFRKALIDDFDEGWKELMKYDWASTRSYLARESPKYPLSVVHWMETRDSGTGGFDRAFAEDILESLEFNDPTKDVEWKCFEGGSKVLIDAMLDKLDDKPFYGHRVTSVKPLFRLPDLPGWPIFPFMEVSIAGQGVEHFTHVVSTASFANLGTIDTDQVPMTYKQRQAIRTLNYGPAVKVAIKFKTRWWESDSLNQRGGSSYTDRQSRVVVYPSAGLGEEGPGVLMATYNWHQDASRFGALIQNPDWSEQLDPDRKRPRSEQVLLEQIYEDLATLHGVTVDWLREQTLDYHAFDWYHNPYTMGAFAHFAPGQFSLLFSDIVQPAGSGRFHFAGEVASYHHAWVAGALDSATRVVREILRLDLPCLLPKLKERSLVFSDEAHAESQFVRGLLSKELEGAGF